MAVGAVSSGMGGVNLGLFIKPMRDDLDIGTSVFGWAQTARIIGFAASGWLIGRLIDKHGARLLLAAAGLVAGAAMIALANVQEGWQIAAVFFVVGTTGIQGGGGSLFMSVPLANWFMRQRGKAMSVAFIGMPVGIFVFAPLSQLLITGRLARVVADPRRRGVDRHRARRLAHRPPAAGGHGPVRRRRRARRTPSRYRIGGLRSGFRRHGFLDAPRGPTLLDVLATHRRRWPAYAGDEHRRHLPCALLHRRQGLRRAHRRLFALR
jgi:hypothetical protein